MFFPDVLHRVKRRQLSRAERLWWQRAKRLWWQLPPVNRFPFSQARMPYTLSAISRCSCRLIATVRAELVSRHKESSSDAHFGKIAYVIMAGRWACEGERPAFMHSSAHALMCTSPHLLIPSSAHALNHSCPHSLLPSCPHALNRSCPHALMPLSAYALMP